MVDLKLYENWTEWATKIWKDEKRADFDADVWYNRDRNQIAMDMILDLCKGKKVLAEGAAMWVDEELLICLECGESTRIDIVQSDGIDMIADACDLPFENESFDFILCRELLEHVKDSDALLEEASRVLVKGGYIFITTPNLFNVLPDGVFHLRAYTPYSLISEIKRFGFEPESMAGSIPNIFYSLLPLYKARYDALPEFKKINEMFRRTPNNYFFGTDLMMLARKQ